MRESIRRDWSRFDQVCTGNIECIPHPAAPRCGTGSHGGVFLEASHAIYAAVHQPLRLHLRRDLEEIRTVRRPCCVASDPAPAEWAGQPLTGTRRETA